MKACGRLRRWAEPQGVWRCLTAPPVTARRFRRKSFPSSSRDQRHRTARECMIRRSGKRRRWCPARACRGKIPDGQGPPARHDHASRQGADSSRSCRCSLRGGTFAQPPCGLGRIGARLPLPDAGRIRVLHLGEDRCQAGISVPHRPDHLLDRSPGTGRASPFDEPGRNHGATDRLRNFAAPAVPASLRAGSRRLVPEGSRSGRSVRGLPATCGQHGKTSARNPPHRDALTGVRVRRRAERGRP